MQHDAFHSTSESDAASQLVGSVVVDKWRIERVLGSGGMASVFSAIHMNNGRRVALKVLHPAVAGIEEVRQRFFEEAYAVNSVDHAGVVPALDDGVLDDGRPFLVMDLLIGETLEDRWNRFGQCLPVEEVLTIGEVLLDILQAAHKGGIIHRDIKPENVFVNSTGQLKLIDFGIAKMMDSQRTFKTRVGDAMGTPAFMPPEQARGRWSEVDERSDLWSLCATLFLLLTGHCVHEGETNNEILLGAMIRKAPAIESIAPHLPKAVCAFINRGLSFNKQDRFESAAEMLACLAEVRRHIYAPIDALTPVSSSRLRYEEYEGDDFLGESLPTLLPLTRSPSDYPNRTPPPGMEHLHSTSFGRSAKWTMGLTAGFLLLCGAYAWSERAGFDYVEHAKAAFVTAPVLNRSDEAQTTGVMSDTDTFAFRVVDLVSLTTAAHFETDHPASDEDKPALTERARALRSSALRTPPLHSSALRAEAISTNRPVEPQRSLENVQARIFSDVPSFKQALAEANDAVASPDTTPENTQWPDEPMTHDEFDAEPSAHKMEESVPYEPSDPLSQRH